MSDARASLFHARPWIVRKAWRQATMDAAIRRGQQLAKERGW